MGYGSAEATGLGFVCFVIINPCALSANRVDLAFLFHKFSNFTPPSPQEYSVEWSMDASIYKQVKALCNSDGFKCLSPLEQR